MDEAGDGEPELRLGIIDRVPADDDDPSLCALIRAALEDLTEHVEGELRAGEPRDVECEARRAPHGVHVAQRVRRRNRAEPVRLVHDRGEHVHGLDQRQVRGNAIHARIVRGVGGHKDGGVGRWGKMAQDLRQVRWT